MVDCVVPHHQVSRLAFRATQWANRRLSIDRLRAASTMGVCEDESVIIDRVAVARTPSLASATSAVAVSGRRRR